MSTKNQLKSDIPEKQEKTSSKKKKGKNPFRSTIEFLLNPKTHKVFSIFMIVFSLLMFISFLSFVITWDKDQSTFSGRSVWEFLFYKGPVVANFAGKVGALISHVFMHLWFGISSFIICFILFVAGFKIFTTHEIVNLKKSVKYGLFFLIWISLALGYIFQPGIAGSSINGFVPGGVMGYQTALWLGELMGTIVTGIFIVGVFMSFLIIAFNISFHITPKLKPLEAEEVNAVSAALVEESKPLVNSLVLDVENEESEVEEESDFVEMETDFPENLDEDYGQVGEIIISSGVSMPIVQTLQLENEVPLAIIETTPENLEATGTIKEGTVMGEYDPKLELSSYKFPHLDLLENHGSNKIQVNKEELEENKNRIVETLGHYNIGIDKIKASIGPTVTLYEIIPKAGVRISKIKNLEDDIALSLSALGIRIIAPIPGKGTIGIEVPNQKPEIVSMRSILGSEKFQSTDMELPFGLGKTISNEVFIADLAKMPHLLMAGATGQGKSVGLNAILVSLLYKKHPSQIKFVLIDPKKVELTLFKTIERHFLAKLPGEDDPIITDTKKVVNTLNSLCMEMDQRFDLLKDASVRNIKEYNAKFISRKLNPNNGHHFLPYIVLVIDEFADLIMTAGKEVETPIARLAQLARAIGIHLIIATQRPSVNIITGTIKANFPARIAFRVTSKIDSRTILDAGGADQLIGRGDMLISTGADLIRIQCGFVDTPEVEKITEFIGSQRGYSSAFILPEYVDESGEGNGTLDPQDRDPLFEDAARLIVMHQQGSTSLVQRKLKLGYNRAGRIIDQLEASGIIGPFEGSKARDVLIKDEMSLEQILSRNK